MRKSCYSPIGNPQAKFLLRLDAIIRKHLLINEILITFFQFSFLLFVFPFRI